MKIPFLSDTDDPDSDTLAEKLTEKRSELADVREQHASAREVVEEREQTLRELRARREVGASVGDAIDEVEGELEEAKKKREELGDRVGALEEAIPILEDRLEQAKAEEVQELYDEHAEQIKSNVERVTELLAEVAELQAEARLHAHQASALVQRHGAADALNTYAGPVGANDMWCLFAPADATSNWISGDEKFSIRVNPRRTSQLENWLDRLETDGRIDVQRPDPVSEGTTKSRFDE